MNKEEFNKRTRTIKIEGAIIALLENANICGIQLKNAQDVFEANDIQGFTPDTIKRMNNEHTVIMNTLSNLAILTELIDDPALDRVKWIVRDSLLDCQRGRFEE